MLLSDLNIHIREYIKITDRRCDIEIIFHESDYLNIIEQYLWKSKQEVLNYYYKSESIIYNYIDLDLNYNRIYFVNQINSFPRLRGIKIERDYCRISSSYRNSVYSKVLTENERIIKNIIE